MKPGRRALGIAESYRGTDDGATSTLAGAVVRVGRTVDDFVFGRCTVGGLDGTRAIIDAWRRLDRPDVRYLLVAGIAPAWYNVLDIREIATAIDRPVLAVSFEASEGLEADIEAAFDGESRAERLETYRSLPERRRIEAGGEPLFVRSVGFDAEPVDAETVVEAYTRKRRPEPLRVAKRLARRADAARRDGLLDADDRRG